MHLTQFLLQCFILCSTIKGHTKNNQLVFVAVSYNPLTYSIRKVYANALVSHPHITPPNVDLSPSIYSLFDREKMFIPNRSPPSSSDKGLPLRAHGFSGIRYIDNDDIRRTRSRWIGI
jgi:hypothetical protein